MGREFPPQRFCDKCDMPDYEYPYTSYTGQIDQVIHVRLCERRVYGGTDTGTDNVGIDMGYLCQACRKELYNKVYDMLCETFSTYKDYPRLLDETTERYTENNGKKVKPWWDRKMEIKSHTGKTLKDGKFVD